MNICRQAQCWLLIGQYLVVLVGLGLEVGLGPLDVEQDVGEHPDGVSVPPHHHVGKAHVVVGGDLATWQNNISFDLILKIKSWPRNRTR